MMKRVIVTGNEGFIGKALTQRLERRGVEVIGMDKKSGVDAKFIGELMHFEKVDCVFHLAAQTSVFNDNLFQIEKDNMKTFMRVVQACNKYGVKLVYASSSTANPENTTSMYGISKHFGEQFAKVYCPTATGCRLHNVYGPNQREGTLLWYLTHEKEVNLFNCGQNIRCFTFIEDVCDGLLMAAECSKQLINIANVQPVTTQYFAELVSGYNGVRINLVDDKRPLDNIEQSVNKDVFLLPLSYTSVEEGIRKIFSNGQR